MPANWDAQVAAPSRGNPKAGPHLYSPDSRRSSEGAKKVSPPACPRGTMLIFVTGSYSGISAPTSACPDCAPPDSRSAGSPRQEPT